MFPLPGLYLFDLILKLSFEYQKFIFDYRKVASSRPVYYSIFDHFWCATKGQLISECLFDVLKFSKKPTENLTNFCFTLLI